ncbi:MULTISPECIES: glycosyltransferase family 4 protein [unclassified Blastococcus]
MPVYEYLDPAWRAKAAGIRPRLAVVRSGAFSGTAISLLAEFADSWTPGAVIDVDVQRLARRVGLHPHRALALLEARAHRSTTWAKTGAWVGGLQRMFARDGLYDCEAMVYVQTIVAAHPPSDVPYVVITDRVGLEGAAQGWDASAATPRWLARERRLLRGARAVFVLGRSTRDWLVQRYGVDPDRIVVTGAAPNMEIPVREGPVRRCRDLLFVGVEWERKGGPELFDVFPSVRERHPELTLTVVGSSPGTPAPDGVTVLGRLPHHEMGRVYAAADALVLPTRNEAFGIAYVEALTAGLPCLGTDVGNVPEIIGEAGVVVRADDRESLASGLLRLVEDFDHLAREAWRRSAELRSARVWATIARRSTEVLHPAPARRAADRAG